MRTIATLTSIGACVVAIVIATGCGGPSSPSENPPTTPQPAPNEQEQPAPEDEPPAQQWPMPDLRDMVLQDAQDQIQALTGGAVYFTDSHDLSGQDRNQVLDANWKVCTQSIEPGAAVTPTSQIDIGVVKLDETCP